MNPNPRTLPLLTIAMAFLACAFAVQAMSVSARLSSQFLVRGERAFLEISVRGTDPERFPSPPSVDGVDITPLTRNARRAFRETEHVFTYRISSYRTGIHEIPGIDIDLPGTVLKTRSLSLEIFEPDELQWGEATAGKLTFRYAATFRALNPNPYEGESTPTEIRLYVPQNLLVDDWGIPEFERDGLTAWRFQPSPAKSQVTLLGSEYEGRSYPSVLTPTRSGDIGIGPAQIRLMTIQAVIDGYIRNQIFATQVKVPRLRMNALPLPENPPAGFTNAVGDFNMSIRTEEQEFMEGDPIPVEILISGTGNLDNLDPPQPSDSRGWKVYEPVREPRGSEREQNSGGVIFRQFMRPLEIVGSLPPYRFVFFDPKKKSYRTLTSEKIPLMIQPAPNTMPSAGKVPNAPGTPIERMTDILGIAQSDSLTRDAAPTPFPSWAWHALAAMTTLCLVARSFWIRFAHRFQRGRHHRIRRTELRELSKISDSNAFLLKAGQFIEKWLGDQKSEELLEILKDRDLTCFCPSPPPNQPVSVARKSEIIRILRQALPLFLVAILVVAPPANGNQVDPSIADRAAEAYQEARFKEAIRLWLQAGNYQSLTADTLYNIGNACYRMGSPGHAALYYRRSLLRSPNHIESRQNLRFIERKYGALTITRPEYQYLLAKLDLAHWKHASAAGVWMLVIGYLLFPATHSGSKWRVVGAVACLTGPMVATIGALGWYYYPNDARFAPPECQAVVVNLDATVHTEASRNSSEVIDAPPGSLCEIVRRSGRWCYISFASKTRGWIPSSAIEPVIPSKPVTPPSIRKPIADESSA